MPILLSDYSRERPGADGVTRGERTTTIKEFSARVIFRRSLALRSRLQRGYYNAAVDERLGPEQTSFSQVIVVGGSTGQIYNTGSSGSGVEGTKLVNVPADSQPIQVVPVLDQLAGCATVGGDQG